MKPDPDQSTIMYSPIHPGGKSLDPDKDLALSTIKEDEMEDEGVSIRDLISASLEFLKNCQYFLRESTKPSMFGKIPCLVYLMK
jgi:hypothetical protein